MDRKSKVEKMTKSLLSFVLFSLLISCGEVIGKKVTLNENYFIEAIDDSKNRSLYYSLKDGGGIGRVNNGVIAVGLDDVYIIIKQQVSGKTRHFILDMRNDSSTADPSDSLHGPYNIDQFNAARIDLNVEETLTFTHNF